VLTRLRIRNLKRLESVDIELGSSVVFIGPNNSGKTTALQALSLWRHGLLAWAARRDAGSTAEKRTGVALNRRDLIALPVPSAKQLWRRLETRHAVKDQGKQKNENIRIDIVVDGIDDASSEAWSCGLEFDYANEESVYCRPLRSAAGDPAPRAAIPTHAQNAKIAFLPPMSGLAAVEPRLERGRIDVLLGEGQTAQVLRNLCYQISEDKSAPLSWDQMTANVRSLFGVEIAQPIYVAARGEITMTYEESDGTKLDISSAGRGLQQTLLLLAHVYANPNAILLLDEPDAHLEILRQGQIYRLLSDLTGSRGSQLICASHIEIVLNEAAERDVVVAFVGRPHRMADRGQQVLKSLAEIGFDQYYQAELKGWALYLEGSTDLAILQAFAKTLGHPAEAHLAQPFVHYVGNKPQRARDHFRGLQEAVPEFLGVAVFDRMEQRLDTPNGLTMHDWQTYEIENHLARKDALLGFAQSGSSDDLVGRAERATRTTAMTQAIAEVESAQRSLGRDAWSADIKASTEVLEPIFRRYFDLLNLPMRVRKTNLYELAKFIPALEIPEEIRKVLDIIAVVAARAKSSPLP
jgi:predicted ATPase